MTNNDFSQFFRLPNDSSRLPTLGNGHIGFTVFAKELYMNGLYNGQGGLSHRARIPNYVNILMEDCARNDEACNFTMNMHHGVFMVKLEVADKFIATHLIYAHRYRDRVLINQIHIQRLGSKG